VELVSVVEHRINLTKEGKEMVKDSEWRMEIVRSDDVLFWKLLFVVDGKEYPVVSDQSLTVSDMFFDAGKELENMLPEIFA
jgi:hypothetical protein